ncbi:MAG TPA: hypothetical protein VFI20_06825, partial [Terracidiphilus sp.]|nr:hypothetical protein [Terracidiphilus sp.]
MKKWTGCPAGDRVKRAGLILFFVVLPVCGLRAETIPGLGTATFPTSAHSALAQQDFMHGLLLLHLFEYPDAAKWFVKAEQADPGFAMAYWGEAMTFNHPIWNQLDEQAGRAALAKFAATPAERSARISNERERDFMAAVDILYSGEGTKRERDAKYAAAMERMSRAFPKDDEAQLFYALALEGESEGVRDVPRYLKAAAIAKAVFLRNPQHPGAAHYWIHGMDDPQHAAGALEAARALSKIAPDAAHAQHMCSHIFVAMGLWNDVVKANLAATSVVNRHAAEAGKPAVHCGHYNIWLTYGYLQQGRLADAKELMTACRADAMRVAAASRARGKVDPDATELGSVLVMRSHYVMVSRRWRGEVAGWKEDTGGAVMAGLDDAFTTGFAAAQAGDAAGSRAALATMDALLARIPAEFDHAGVPADDPGRSVPGIERMELAAAVEAAEGQMDKAIAGMEQAAAQENGLAFAFGPPWPEKPANEFLGELLLKAKQPRQARAAFEAALKRAPRRTES